MSTGLSSSVKLVGDFDGGSSIMIIGGAARNVVFDLYNVIPPAIATETNNHPKKSWKGSDLTLIATKLLQRKQPSRDMLKNNEVF